MYYNIIGRNCPDLGETMLTLHQLRKEKKIRMIDIASKLGVSQGHYSNLERGKRTISDALLEKIAQVLGEQKDTVLSAVKLSPVESLTLKSWLSNVRISGLPFIKAFRYHMENACLDVASIDNVGLKKELRSFIESNIGFSLLAELSENKQLIEQIRSKLCGENTVKKESDNIHEQPTGNE
jgi:transcriptional regulator with XRE-family HTH domain